MMIVCWTMLLSSRSRCCSTIRLIMRISSPLISFNPVYVLTNLLILYAGVAPISKALAEAHAYPDAEASPDPVAWPAPVAMAEANANPVALPDADANPLALADPMARNRPKTKHRYSNKNKGSHKRGKGNTSSKNKKHGDSGKITKDKSDKSKVKEEKKGLMHSLKSAAKTGIAEATGSFGGAVVNNAVDNAASKYFESMEVPENGTARSTNARQESEEKD